MDLKNEKCIIIGKTGSGKTHLMNKLIGKGLKPCLKWTTRPPRKFENQFIDYSKVDYNNVIPVVKKYFSPSNQIINIVDNLKQKYHINYD